MSFRTIHKIINVINGREGSPIFCAAYIARGSPPLNSIVGTKVSKIAMINFPYIVLFSVILFLNLSKFNFVNEIMFKWRRMISLPKLS